MCACCNASHVVFRLSPPSCSHSQALYSRRRMRAASSGPRASFDIPSSNVASSGPVLDDRHVVYGVAMTRFHRPVWVSCGQQPFTNFQVEVYVRDYQRRATSITVSQPRLLFHGPRGAQILLYSLSRNSLVYSIDTPQVRGQQDRWQLFARNVMAGRTILLDSSEMEGQQTSFRSASSDGMTVLWQSSRQIFGPTMLGVWSYSLATGRRQLLLSGGAGAGFSYSDSRIWGS